MTFGVGSCLQGTRDRMYPSQLVGAMLVATLTELLEAIGSVLPVAEVEATPLVWPPGALGITKVT